jgi:hypothetical protein
MATHGHDQHAHGHGHAHGSDKGAAFVGLFGGLIFLGAVVYGLVVWTNGRFEGHRAGGAAPAAGAEAKH